MRKKALGTRPTEGTVSPWGTESPTHLPNQSSPSMTSSLTLRDHVTAHPVQTRAPHTISGIGQWESMDRYIPTENRFRNAFICKQLRTYQTRGTALCRQWGHYETPLSPCTVVTKRVRKPRERTCASTPGFGLSVLLSILGREPT